MTVQVCPTAEETQSQDWVFFFPVVFYKFPNFTEFVKYIPEKPRFFFIFRRNRFGMVFVIQARRKVALSHNFS